MQNFDELAEKYISAVEKQKVSDNRSTDTFTRGDMETCYVVGAQEASELQEGIEGTFGQAIGSLKHGKLVARKGWNGKGMFLFMRPMDLLKDDFIINIVKSLPDNFKEWVKAHPAASNERYFTQYICMKAADGAISNGWNPSTPDVLAEDWVIVAPTA